MVTIWLRSNLVTIWLRYGYVLVTLILVTQMLVTIWLRYGYVFQHSVTWKLVNYAECGYVLPVVFFSRSARAFQKPSPLPVLRMVDLYTYSPTMGRTCKCLPYASKHTLSIGIPQK